jgi:hypothetical protein
MHSSYLGFSNNHSPIPLSDSNLVTTQYFTITGSPSSPVADPNSYTKIVPASYCNLTNVVGSPIEIDFGSDPITSLLPEDQTFVLYSTVGRLHTETEEVTRFINGTSWKTQSEPTFPLLSLDREDWNQKPLVPWTGDSNRWIEIIVNNVDERGHTYHLVSSP